MVSSEGRLVSRADVGVDADGGATGKGVVVVPLLLKLWQQASERGEKGDGVSAVEAGQSCSRHQGRHFL